MKFSKEEFLSGGIWFALFSTLFFFFFFKLDRRKDNGCFSDVLSYVTKNGCEILVEVVKNVFFYYSTNLFWWYLRKDKSVLFFFFNNYWMSEVLFINISKFLYVGVEMSLNFLKNECCWWGDTSCFHHPKPLRWSFLLVGVKRVKLL